MSHSGLKVLLVPKYSLSIFRQVGLVVGNGIIAKLLDLFRVPLVTVVNVGGAKFNVYSIL